MVIAQQYPHYIYIYTQTESTQDATTGSWNVSTPTLQYHAMGRDETNGRGNAVNSTDGKTLTFSSTIYMPVGTTRIDEGTEVIVTKEKIAQPQTITEATLEQYRKDGRLVSRGQCLKFDGGRLHCRMWI